MLPRALIFARPDWQSLIFGHGPHVLSEKCEDAAFASQMLPRALIFARPDWQSLIFGHGSHALSFFRSHLHKLAVEGLIPRHLNLSMLLWADPNMPSIVPRVIKPIVLIGTSGKGKLSHRMLLLKP
jgi:hypothetical protein